MDILITLVYVSKVQLEDYIKEIKASNLPKPMQWDLIDLLETARRHTEDAVKMAWVKE